MVAQAGENHNMSLWEKLCTPPAEATRPIQAGRLKGKTDINPQWRLEVMTEVFGPVGIGWRYTIDRLWLEPAADNQVVAFALVSVYYRTGGEWSEPIPGIGGNMLVEQESKGLHVSDEAYKMAVTDALSVALKALGVAADVYRGIYDTKYANARPEPLPGQAAPASYQQRPPSQDDTPVVSWGRGNPAEGKTPSKWHGMTYQQVWDAGSEGHSYLHWVAEKSTLSDATKRGVRAFLDQVQGKGGSEDRLMTLDEITALRKEVEAAGMDLAAYGEKLREIDAQYGGVPYKWGEAVRARLAEVEHEAGDRPQMNPEAVAYDDDIPF